MEELESDEINISVFVAMRHKSIIELVGSRRSDWSTFLSLDLRIDARPRSSATTVASNPHSSRLLSSNSSD